MDPPSVNRQRLVRDYSTEGMFNNSSKTAAAPARERWASPHRQPSSENRDPPRKPAASSPREKWASPQRQHFYENYEPSTRPTAPSAPEKTNGHLQPAYENYEPPSRRDEYEDSRRLEFNLSPVGEKESQYEPSIASTQPTINSTSSSRLADFFSSDVFQIVLHNPTTAHQLKKFAQMRLCGENLEFLEKVDQYQYSLNQVTKTVFEIHRNFISVNSPNQINLPNDVLVQINKNLKQLLAKTMPSMESVFLTAQNDIQRLVASDVYPRFVRHQMTLSVTRALATNKNKYAGLGDCFVLTNPSKADNPIVYASDGFVKVTGYERNEIIPRNCRFLQTRQTDRESVARIKKSLDKPAESVELLLNERKDGEPFWNLLYTAPLYDSSGKLAFFIGGQINISTTIHNQSDVLRILSSDADEPEAQPVLSPSAKPARQSSFFGTFRKSNKPVLARTPGMENELIGDMQNMSFKQQKQTFYSAYSKYIIVNAETMLISFFSAGIVELLYAAKPTMPGTQIVGQEVFKFLGQHAAGGLARDYKTRVKTVIKTGVAATIDLTLCTRRIMGFEQFLTHWTPLKDDRSAVAYVVLTLGSMQDAK